MLTLYISAASDLMAEREALARMVAALPVALTWHILQTPITHLEPLDLEALGSADVYLLLMGGDIRAPVGLEWLTARRAGLRVRPYLKRGVPRTPAGQVFIKDVGLAWQPFADAADLSRVVQRVLVDHLLQHARRYALTSDEITSLEGMPAEAQEEEPGVSGEEAGHSAVIL